MTEVISVIERFSIPWIVDRGKKIIKILILCFMSLEVQFSYIYLTKKSATGITANKIERLALLTSLMLISLTKGNFD